jgi:hypothetical protein
MHEVMQPRLLAMLCILAVFVPTFFLLARVKRAPEPAVIALVGLAGLALTAW